MIWLEFGTKDGKYRRAKFKPKIKDDMRGILIDYGEADNFIYTNWIKIIIAVFSLEVLMFFLLLVFI